MNEEMIAAKWEVGFRDRGHGYGDHGIIWSEGLVVECPSYEVAVHLTHLHNKYIESIKETKPQCVPEMKTAVGS